MFKKYLLVLAFAGLSAYSCAAVWQWQGPRAMAMGGAGVACAYGTDAQYWNPALLVHKEGLNDRGFMFDVGASGETTKNVLKSIDKFNDLSDSYKTLSNKIESGSAPDAKEISALFTGLSTIHDLVANDIGAMANADAGVGFKIKNFAVSVRSMGSLGVTPVIDTLNLGLGTQGGLSGLNLGSSSSPSGSVNAQAASTLASAIDAHPGLLNNLNTLLGSSYSGAQEMANAFVNGAVNAGSSPDEILKAAQEAAANMSGAAQIINAAASSSGINSYKDNQTRAIADMNIFSEASLGYGIAIIKGLQVGGNVKVINGTVAQTGILLLQDNDNAGDIIKDAWDRKQNTVRLAADLGAFVNFSELVGQKILFNPQIGISAKNINSPKFKRPGLPDDLIGATGAKAALASDWQTGDYELKPQVRAGLSLNPLHFITIASDIDLTKNDTTVQGYDSRQLAAGIEINVVNRKSFNLPLRAGINKNLAESNAPTYYTAGLGINTTGFYLELAGALSAETTKVNDTTIPSAAAASLNLGFVF